MSAVITALTAALTDTAFFAIVEDVVPLITLIIPIALGLMFLRKLLRGFARGRLSF